MKKNLLAQGALWGAALITTYPVIAGLNLSDAPMFVTEVLAPNIILSPIYGYDSNEVAMMNPPRAVLNACKSDDWTLCPKREGKNPRTNLNFPDPDPYFVLPNIDHAINSRRWASSGVFDRNTQRMTRVTPWPGTEGCGLDGVSSPDQKAACSVVSIYPNDKTISGPGWNPSVYVNPLQYREKPDGNGVIRAEHIPRDLVTEEPYYQDLSPVELAAFSTYDAGRSKYLRSSDNFLYYNYNMRDKYGNVVRYGAWPGLGVDAAVYTPVNYTSDDPASVVYNPLRRTTITNDELGTEIKADLGTTGTGWVWDTTSADNMSHLIGQYYVRRPGEDVWKSVSYDSHIWSGMTPEEKRSFAHWFTYWRSSYLATRGMLAGVVNELYVRDMLYRLRIGLSYYDSAARQYITALDLVSPNHEELSDVAVRNTKTAAFAKRMGNIIFSDNSDFSSANRPVDPAFDLFSTLPPYRDDPRTGGESTVPRSCRRNYEILLTPDYTTLRHDWGATSGVPNGSGDGVMGTPYADTFSNTWGDYGAKGWKTDLRTDLADNLLKSKDDEAQRQHLVRYLIGPKMEGNHFPSSIVTYEDLLDRANTATWKDVVGASSTIEMPDTIDDLWHMALNSRGMFYPSDSVKAAIDNLLAAFNDILVRNVSGSAVATNTSSLRGGGKIYQATVESDWKGHLRAYNVTPNEAETILQIDYRTELWDLAAKVSAQSGRKIATFNGTVGVPFLWANIGDTAKTLLKTAVPPGVTNANVYGSKLLAYLRGSGECEDGSGFNCTSGVPYTFRRRNIDSSKTSAYSVSNPNGRNVLGDIANSNPWLVPPPPAGPSDVDFPDYNAFRVANKTRRNVLYVGANDGMLHAVDARNGAELFAYIPSFVQTNLYQLAGAGYAHKFFVDGSPFSADVDLGGTDGWRTVLAGGANKGGKGYYLLDVTSPTTNTELNAATWVKWEFTHPRDLHYTFNLPVADGYGQARQIARMNDENLALIVGNGYPEEAGKKACLFILYLSGPGAAPVGDLEGVDYHGTDGTGYHKLCAGVADYSATGTNDGGLDTNGLSTPTPVDLNGDGKVDAIYAGDLNGNMWRFDVASETPANWAVAYSGAPLFVAKNAATPAKRQPIITSPEVTLHETTSKPLVLFGTGKYIEGDDRANTDVQSFYGVLDRGLTGITRGNLLAQTFELDETNNQDIRKQTANSKKQPTYCTAETLSDCPNDTVTNPAPATNRHLGWFWDMPTRGERLTGKMSLINGVVAFNTFFPAIDTYDCDGAGPGTALCTRLDADDKAMLDPCQYGGGGWQMGLNAVNGYMEDQFSVFDVNLDGVIDSGDVRSAGVKIGAVMGGTTFAKGIGNTYVGVGAATSDNYEALRTPPVTSFGTAGSGRVSWFELLD